MGVIKRLQRLTGEDAQAAEKEERTEQLSELRRRIEAIMARRPEQRGSRDAPSHSPFSAPSRQGALYGEERHNAYGSFFLSQRHHDGSHGHGGRSIREFSAPDMNMAALLARSPQLAEFGIADGLFLDVETTGLAGGTGTIAFLIGLLYPLYTITGFDASSTGLGISAAANAWVADTDIDAAVTQLDTALGTLRSNGKTMASNLNVVTTRQEFTSSMIATLQEGADSLTAADLNEESANMLALQTRQQLGIVALSLSSQAQQSILQLF